MARSCVDLMEQADLTEISEALWAGTNRGALSQKLCYDETNACKKRPPPLPKVSPRIRYFDLVLTNAAVSCPQ